MEIEKAMTEGLVFRGAKKPAKKEQKVKTKAKKKSFVSGSHGSGAAKMREAYRIRRANRHKKD